MRLFSLFLRLSLACACVIAVPSLAQVDDDIVASYAGRLLALPTTGELGCEINLIKASGANGLVVRPDPKCAQTLPQLRNVRVWSVEDGIVLKAQNGASLMGFSADETGLLSNPSVADPDFYLVPFQAGLTRAPTRASSTGRWQVLAATGARRCFINLGTDGRLTVPSACRLPSVTRWRLEAFTLFLEGPRDRQLTFETVANNRFDGPNSIRLSR